MNRQTRARLVWAVVLGIAVIWMSSPVLGAERVASATLMASAVSKAPFEVPPIAKQLKISGTVELDVTVDENGAVEKADILKGNPVLGKAAQDSIKKWKFKPIRIGDQAVKAVATVSCEFK